MSSYDEESKIAQSVLDRMASNATPSIPSLRSLSDVRAAGVRVGNATYVVSRHGNDLRFHEQNARHGAGRSLIVQVGRHVGGWLIARAVRPPGEYHDSKAAELARFIVERNLIGLGHEIGTSGASGERKSAAVLDREIEEVMRDIAPTEIIRQTRGRRRRG